MLRDYQIQNIADIREAAHESGSVVYVLPTGGGKTVVAGEIARSAVSFKTKTLFLVHRRELVDQAYKTLSEFCPGVRIGFEVSKMPREPWADIHIGMVQSMRTRDYSNINYGLIIVDEAHHVRASMWEAVLKVFPDALRIGLTATPRRLDGKGLHTHFDRMVMGPTIAELVEDGYLAPVKLLRIPLVDRKAIKYKRHGDIARESIPEVVNDKTVASAAEAYMRYINGNQTIFFGANRDHSQRVCATLRGYGIAAEHVDGTDHASRRDRVMREFRDNVVTVVGNCDLISEGYDAPACRSVMFGYPTKSIVKWMQANGRSMRPGEDKIAVNLDLGGSSYELGLPDEDREWSLEDGEKKQPKKETPPLKTCGNCRAVYSGDQCKHCGWVPGKGGVGYDEEDLELEEARRTEQLKKKRNGPRMSRKELNRQLHICMREDDPHAALVQLAEKNGYKVGWANHIYEVLSMKRGNR